MRILIVFTFVVFFGCTSYAQNTGIKTAKPDSTKKIETVDAACGQCQFHLPGKGCNLAIRIDGKAYFVDGTTIDEHGDAHATDGFCEAIRKAAVQGEIVNGRYKITYFKLLKIVPKEDEKKM